MNFPSSLTKSNYVSYKYYKCNQKLLALICVVVSLSCIRNLNAYEVTPSDLPVKLDDYIVETNATTLSSKAPAVTEQILASDLEAYNIPEAVDALNYLPDLYVRTRFVGDENALVSIRGSSNLQYGRTLVIADGILLSNFLGTSSYSAPRFFLESPEEIAKIAVSYGPYSSLYAGNSIGGTILMTSIMPTHYEADASVGFMTQDFHDYQTARYFNGRTAHFSLGNKVGKFSYQIFYNYLLNNSQPLTFNTILVSATTNTGAGTPTTGAVAQPNLSYQPWLVYGSPGPTQSEQNLFKAKFAYDISNDTYVRYTLAYWIGGLDVLHPESYLKDVNGNTVWGGQVLADGQTFTIKSNDFPMSQRNQTDMINAVVLAHEPSEGLQFVGSGSVYNGLKDNTYASTTNYPTALLGGAGTATRLGNTGWEDIDFKAGWRSFSGALANHSPVLGFHFDRYYFSQVVNTLTNWKDSTSITGETSANGGETNESALYAQDTWKLAPQWTLTPGVRWEAWNAGEGMQVALSSGKPVLTDYPIRRQSEVSPKFTLAYEPLPLWSLKLSLGQAWRFPTVGELFQGTVSANGSITQNDPTLRPERDLAKDLTLEHALVFGELRISAFEDDIHDALVSQSNVLPTGGSLSYVANVTHTRDRGLEVSFAKHKLLNGAFDCSASISYNNAVTLANPTFPTSVGKQFPRIPHWQWKTVFTYHVNQKLSLNADTRYSSNQYNTLDNSDGHGGYTGTDNFIVTDCKGVYHINRDITFNLGIDNITSRVYYFYHPLPQRSLFSQLAWKY
jgi:iron complex outermembrane recepter protein